MAIVEEGAYASSSQPYQTFISHRRYPSSIPTIKEVSNRGTLARSKDDLTNVNRKSSIAYRHDHHSRLKNPFHKNSGSSDSRYSTMPNGRAPTIISSVASPAPSRKTSIHKRKKRFMMNSKELRNQFFYPVNAPKRRRSRHGKYRNNLELDSSMNYINIDSSMSKDLCLNQTVYAFEISNKDLLKMNPKFQRSLKVITIDSNNNYIIYTPNPTPGKNSVIADAEQILNEELLKLGRPVPYDEIKRQETLSTNPQDLPQYRILRPDFHRYDTFPITEKPFLIRTNSLPSNINKNNESMEALWNLYLRRVIAMRIKWRLTHSRDNSLVHTPESSKNIKSFTSSNRLQRNSDPNRRISMTSSVDTGFFINQLLRDDLKRPMSDDEIEPMTSEEEQEGRESRSSSTSSPRRQVMFESLEQLMAEVTSVMSEI